MPRLAMQLDRMKHRIRDPFERLHERRVNPDQNSGDIGRQRVDPRSRLIQIDEPWAVEKKIEPQRIGTALDRKFSVDRIGDSADFNKWHCIAGSAQKAGRNRRDFRLRIFQDSSFLRFSSLLNSQQYYNHCNDNLDPQTGRSHGQKNKKETCRETRHSEKERFSWRFGEAGGDEKEGQEKTKAH